MVWGSARKTTIPLSWKDTSQQASWTLCIVHLLPSSIKECAVIWLGGVSRSRMNSQRRRLSRRKPTKTKERSRKTTIGASKSVRAGILSCLARPRPKSTSELICVSMKTAWRGNDCGTSYQSGTQAKSPTSMASFHPRWPTQSSNSFGATWKVSATTTALKPSQTKSKTLWTKKRSDNTNCTLNCTTQWIATR